MPYKLSIPGQVSEHQLKAIEAVAALVPKAGKVVEVGSLFGRSSWAWARSVDSSVTVYCIDPWEKNAGVRSMEVQYGISYGLEQFKRYTVDCPNLQPLRGYSPMNFLDWSDSIDLYYEDAVHMGPILAENLAFWSNKVKPGGIICGDDYRPRFPDVRRGAHELAERFGRELIRVDFFWCLLPEEDVLPGSARVAERLRALSREVDALKRKRGFLFSIGPRRPISPVKSGETLVVPCRVSNESIDTWPSQSAGTLSIGARIIMDHRPGVEFAESRASLALTQLEPDMPVDVDLVLPTATLSPGSYQAVFDLIGPDSAWVRHAMLTNVKGFRLEIVDNTTEIDLAIVPNAPQSEARAKSAAEEVSAAIDTAGASFGVPIFFGVEGESQRYSREGWVLPEANHRWMFGETSRLVFDVAKPPGLVPGATVFIAMKAKPLVAPERLDRQSLSIEVNGATVFEGAIGEATTIEASVPAATFFAAQPAEIVFRHPDGARPCDLFPGSLDRKTLSFVVSEVVLTLLDGRR